MVSDQKFSRHYLPKVPPTFPLESEINVIQGIGFIRKYKVKSFGDDFPNNYDHTKNASLLALSKASTKCSLVYLVISLDKLCYFFGCQQRETGLEIFFHPSWHK